MSQPQNKPSAPSTPSTAAPAAPADDLFSGFAELPKEVWEDQPYREDSEDAQYADVFYLHLNDEFEARGAQAWRDKRMPKVPAPNVLAEIPLTQLMPKSIIFILARKGTPSNPVKPAQPVSGERNDQGFFIHTTRTPAELADEFAAYGGTRDRPGIRVGDFYKTRHGRFGSGLKIDELVDEICKFSMPYVPKFRDASEKEGGQRGTVLYLGFC